MSAPNPEDRNPQDDLHPGDRRQSVSQIRKQVIEAQRERARQVGVLDAARRALAADRQQNQGRGETEPESAQRYENALNALLQAQAGEKTAREALRRGIASALEPRPEADIAKLDARHPILLLPVRIETRFERGEAGGMLKVRIYPDSIHADTHEPLLSADEVALGQAYWRSAWKNADERPGWSALVQSTNPQRAAWVVRQTAPTNLDAIPSDPDGPGEPLFPDLPTRPQQWQRPVEARALPERWLVLGFRGGTQVFRAVSLPVQQPLALTIRLSSDGPEEPLNQAVDLGPGGLQVDPEILWTFDYPTAEAAGMAVTVPLTPQDFSLGFERVLVFGVRATGSPDESAQELAALLDSHHYGRGLALVAQGIPTNNTSGEPSGVPPVDPDGAYSFQVERGSSLAVERGDSGRLERGDSGRLERGDGVRLVSALGLPPEAAAHIAGADGQEERRARAMAEALWPATLEYFLEQLMAPVFERGAVDAAHDYFVGWVRGRGPFSAFRVGEVPYGLLPASSLTAWEPSPAPRGRTLSGPALHLPPFLRRVRDLWFSLTGGVARVNRSEDADGDLLEALALDASSREVRVRSLLGREAQWNLFGLFGLEDAKLEADRGANTREILTLLGHPEWDPRIAWATFRDRAGLFTGGLVDKDPVSERQALVFDYIRWIRAADVQELRAESLPAGVERPTALLYLMLRHAFLNKFARTGKHILLNRRLVEQADLKEPELVGVFPKKSRAGAALQTVWDLLDRPVPGLTGSTPLGQYLGQSGGGPADGERQPVSLYRESLQMLEGLPTAELERLFTETLDVCSYRADAWITSLVSQRLAEMREAQPGGIHLGAYAWVEDLHPDPPNRRRSVTGPRGERFSTLTGSGGYIYAPSMLHAATAALLRSAYQTRSGAQQEPYAVDLSSARVRLALWLLDTVREGQPLGAGLGYRFERGLHEGHAPLELDKFIDDFRRLYPLAANKSGEAPGPAESIAARNVVDGLTLRRAWLDGEIPWGSSGLTPNDDERQAIEAELKALDEAVDATADLLLAESVYQTLRGSLPGAGASLDSAARGIRPPEPEIARAPRGGISLYQRAALLLGGEALPGGAWADPPATPRALAEPVLNAWVGSLLGRPEKTICLVSSPDPADETTAVTRRVTLADLKIEPLDFLALVTGLETPGDAELDRRVADAAAPLFAAGARVAIQYNPPGLAADERTFLERIELARAVNALLGSARPLQPRDLLSPDKESAAEEADLLPAELAQRAGDALDRLSHVLSALSDALTALRALPEETPTDLADLRDALREAALFGISGAYPGSASQTRAGWVQQGVSVLAEMEQRRQAALNAGGPLDSLKAVFGRGFFVIPRFKPAQAALLGQNLSAGPSLGDSPAAALRTWLAQAARVRPGLGRWNQLRVLARAQGIALGSPRVLQFPYQPGARWAGLPFAPEQRPRDGLASMLLYGPAAPDPTQPWAGVQVDEWIERIPAEEEDAALAFNYDSPAAQAPQTLLLAVPPANQENWDFASLVSILHETLDLAKIRAVDGEAYGLLGQLLPAAYLAANPSGDTVSTHFNAFLRGEVKIARPGGE